ncbi:hypothetical protein ALNOE001_06070 [Candidatus Methanobinarius endosymbioticus]|uniref:Right handed beta helix domain-containing protein n=1 Tax=Candidatus Methanobinarius endosymbioticus TaxID=2006182 RepID=A0A366MCG7_9EURY|nr:hypothetical protein ALNOE001_06070 [Candidatus Methanobinarius endosymbioticus]
MEKNLPGGDIVHAGGILSTDNMSVKNSVFTNNSATSDGGVIWNRKWTNLTNCALNNNSAWDGGTTYLDGANIINCFLYR